MKKKMKVLLLTSIHGIIALDSKNDSLIDIAFKDLSIKDLAHNYSLINKEEMPEQFRLFLIKLKEQGFTEFEVENPIEKALISQIEDMKGIYCENTVRLKRLREKLIQFFMDANIKFNASDLNERSKTLSEIMIKEEISETATQDDFQVKQAVDSLVDIDKSINFFSSRLREWYGLHFPELTDKLIEDNIQFAKVVSKLGKRKNITIENLTNVMHFDERRATNIFEKAQRSMGGKISDQDNLMIQTLSNKILNLIEYRKNLEHYINDKLEKITPNLIYVLGSQITGKLLSIAGSLERFAAMSSSTVQVLGAEKALFKAIKSGGNTPKYGIIFQWNKIRGAKSYLRGKIARMVAGKISILAKVDFYQGDFIGEEYKKMIDKKVKLIEKQFPKPPKKENKPQSKRSKSKYHGKNRGSSRKYKGKSKKYHDDKKRGKSNRYNGRSRSSKPNRYRKR